MRLLGTPLSLSTPNPTRTRTETGQNLSSKTTLNFPVTHLTIQTTRPTWTVIRMGGGPRTYPGGVSKWQWKRMQSKKASQLLKARLARERHIYEMRKRAELMAAVADLERPWQVIQKKAAPRNSALFSVAADEQLKVLADRFQKPGGFDLWTGHDGPQIFVTPDEGIPTARFFPKGVVHSIRPYGRIDHGNDVDDSTADESVDIVGRKSGDVTGAVQRKNGHRKRIGSTSRDDQKMESYSGNPPTSFSKPSSNSVEKTDAMQRKNGYRKRMGSTSRDDRKIKSNDGTPRRNWIPKSSFNDVNNWNGGVSRMNGDHQRFGEKNEFGRKSTDSRQDLEGGTRGSKGGNKWSGREQNSGRERDFDSGDVYDMRLQGDGNYGFSGNDQGGRVSPRVYDRKMIKSNFRERNKGR